MLWESECEGTMIQHVWCKRHPQGCLSCYTCLVYGNSTFQWSHSVCQRKDHWNCICGLQMPAGGQGQQLGRRQTCRAAGSVKQSTTDLKLEVIHIVLRGYLNQAHWDPCSPKVSKQAGKAPTWDVCTQTGLNWQLQVFTLRFLLWSTWSFSS